MDRHSHSTTILVLIMVSCSLLHEPARAALGVNYGQLGFKLPPPEKAIQLIKSIGATKVRLFDANPTILRAFANTGVEVSVMVKNEEVPYVCINVDRAAEWVKSNVVPYLPGTKITVIAVGNELLSQKNATLAECLFPALTNVFGALINLGLLSQVRVTTPLAFSVLAESNPPSAGMFRPDFRGILSRTVHFLSTYVNPIWFNVYPYLAYRALPERIDLNYATFRPNKGINDTTSKLHYDNLFFAQLDAIHSAIEDLGVVIPFHVSETGWPSRGGPNQVGCTPENAASYNGNLMKMIAQGKTTPLRPKFELDVYISSLFNEGMKQGPESDKNFGLFLPDGTPAYPFKPAS